MNGWRFATYASRFLLTPHRHGSCSPGAACDIQRATKSGLQPTFTTRACGRCSAPPSWPRLSFGTFLPAKLLRRMDLSTIELQPDHFIDPRLGWRATDLLFRIRIDGRNAFLYIVLEHQSTVDRWMAWRQMRSVVLIWDKGDDPKRTKLPFILPIVVSQASQRWSAPTDVKDLVDLPDVPELEGKVPSLSYLLLDLRAMSDGQILAFAGDGVAATIPADPAQHPQPEAEGSAARVARGGRADHR